MLAVALMPLAFSVPLENRDATSLLKKYTVASGDTVDSIAKRLGVAMTDINTGSDINAIIYPGQVVTATCNTGEGQCCACTAKFGNRFPEYINCDKCADMTGYRVAECESYCCPSGSWCETGKDPSETGFEAAQGCCKAFSEKDVGPDQRPPPRKKDEDSTDDRAK